MSTLLCARVLARIVALGLLGLVAGCGTNTPKIPPELLTGGGCTAPEYPNGPFGSEEGQRVANTCFQGFRSPASSDHSPASLETLAFSDYYDPTGSQGIRLVLLNTAAIWCSACRTEHETLSQKNDQYSARGLRILSTLFQDAARNPATPEQLKTWVETFGSNYPMALDPDYQMGSYAPADTAPLNLLVDARTMTIQKKWLGDQDSVLWPYIDAALPLSCGLSLALAAHSAAALEPGVLGEPVTLDITEASTVSYNVDNRDSRPNQVATRANDNWGIWHNRLNVIGTDGAFRVGVRVDNAWFFRSPNPTQIGLDLWASRPATTGGAPAPVYFRQKVNEAGVELSNRYINWVYPAKYFVSYESRDVEVTLGDGYAQFGRGLVLSLRKLDELSSDTTLRGARITGHLRASELELSATALGGELNPLRIDAASGRYLGVDSSVLPGPLAVLEAGMPRAVSTDFAPNTGNCATFATCSYAPDRLAGAQILAKHGPLAVGVQGSLLERTTPLSADAVHAARRIGTESASLELSDLAGHGAAYLELALQQLDRPVDGAPLDPGQALYTSVSLEEGALTLLAEGKHYRRFFPLLANVSTLRAREFGLLAASAPPTTEALFTDTEFENLNTCVSGGRLRADVSLSRTLSAYAWAGYYQSYAESVANDACHVSRNSENDIWDTTSGLEMHSRDRRSKADISLGTRLDSTPRELATLPGSSTHVFYRELYSRHQARIALNDTFSLELQGWHRRRHQTVGGPASPWSEGDETVGLDIAPNFWLAAGFSYDTNPAVPPTYLNGQVGYHLSSDSSLSLFFGQRRGALRCVGGVCRVFPPFEGASLDAVLRF